MLQAVITIAKNGGCHCHGRDSETIKSTKRKISTNDTISTPKISKSTSLSPELVKKTQRYLNVLGYNAGEEDGVAGRKTREAIKDFQSEVSEDVDGIPSEALLKKLVRAANR